MIVTSELNEEEHIALRPLTNRLTEETYGKYLGYVERLDTQEKQLADITMQVVIAVNNDSINEWKRRNGDMCEALKELMRDEIEEGRAEGKMEGRLTAMVELVRDNLLSIAEAAKRLGMAEGELKKLL